MSDFRELNLSELNMDRPAAWQINSSVQGDPIYTSSGAQVYYARWLDNGQYRTSLSFGGTYDPLNRFVKLLTDEGKQVVAGLNWEQKDRLLEWWVGVTGGQG